MKIRETISVFLGLAVAVGVFVLVIWLLNQPAGAAPAPPPPPPPELEEESIEEVVVSLAPLQQEEEPEVNEVDVATLSEGETSSETAEEEMPPEESLAASETPEIPVEPVEPQIEEAEETPEENDPDALARVDPPDPIPMPKPEEPETELTEASPQTARGNLEGYLPPLENRGETEKLWKKYPRLPVVWVYEEPTGENDIPRVLLEAVLDKNGELGWRNLRSDRKWGNYTLASMRYHAGERISLKPEKSELWNRQAEILQFAGLRPEEAGNRLAWGSYRHQAEGAALAPVRIAFAAAVENGLPFDPAQNQTLRVVWKFNEQDHPFVESAALITAEREVHPIELPDRGE